MPEPPFRELHIAFVAKSISISGTQWVKSRTTATDLILLRDMARWLFLYLSPLLIAGFPSADSDHEKAIDTQRSSLVIHVGKAGFLSAVGHEHCVSAPIANGTLDDASAIPSVRFLINSAKLTVIAERNLGARDLAEMQSNMQNKVLESCKYPKIVFESTHVERIGDDAWKGDGILTLHGVMRRRRRARRENDAYIGTVRIRQTDFDIQPIQVGGGAVKVKNEIEIRFELYTTGS